MISARGLRFCLGWVLEHLMLYEVSVRSAAACFRCIEGLWYRCRCWREYLAMVAAGVAFAIVGTSSSRYSRWKLVYRSFAGGSGAGEDAIPDWLEGGPSRGPHYGHNPLPTCLCHALICTLRRIINKIILLVLLAGIATPTNRHQSLTTSFRHLASCAANGMVKLTTWNNVTWSVRIVPAVIAKEYGHFRIC